MNLTSRQLENKDFGLILEWRSDSVTREMSKYTGSVTAEGFKPVFNQYLTEPNRSYLVLHDSNPVGIVTAFQTEPGKYEIGINLNPEYRGQGLSRSVLKLVIDDYFRGRDLVKELTAMVKLQNLGSVKLFERVGFQLENQDDQYYYYLLQL